MTVRLRPPRWLRWFSRPDRHGGERTYGLDAAGREVYESCDGVCRVSDIVTGFAKTHRLSRGEAQQAVTAFLKTLLERGLVMMELTRSDAKEGGDD